MIIQHNLSAMNADRMFGLNNKTQAKSTEKLSSGYKINRAADDASGLAISEKMRRQIRGLRQAVQNAQDGVSMVQIADGAMAEIHEMLKRGTELSVKAANGTLSEDDRSYIQMEIDQLMEEIDGIAERTLFNEIKVLKGETYPVDVVEGSVTEVVSSGGLPDWVAMTATGKMSETYTNTVTWTETISTGTPAVTTVVATGTIDIKHAAAFVDFSNFTGTPDQIQDLIGKGFYTTCCTCTNHYSIRFTSGENHSKEMSGSQFVFNIGIDNVHDAEELMKRIVEGTDNGQPTAQNGQAHYTMLTADVANKTLIIYDGRSSEVSPPNVATQGGKITWSNWPGGNMLWNTVPRGGKGQFGAGVVTEVTRPIKGEGDVKWPKVVPLQIGADSDLENKLIVELPFISCKSIGLDEVDVTVSGGPESGIDSFAAAIENVSRERSRLGAYQNRLEHTIKNLNNVIENTTAAESRIRDTDMATEMVRYSGLNIMLQAGQSMMAQANQQTQGVLSLLQ